MSKGNPEYKNDGNDGNDGNDPIILHTIPNGTETIYFKKPVSKIEIGNFHIFLYDKKFNILNRWLMKILLGWEVKNI